MERNTNLATIMFPVEIRPIGFQSETSKSANEDRAQNSPTVFEAIDKYQAIVRVDTGTVFSVVTSRYELLHNSRALDLGKKAFQLLFPNTSESDFIPFDIRSTKTGSACHVDLIHTSYNTNVWEQETWLPFLRVSNSYNRSRALTFDFGFVRKLCSNGLIFQKESVRVKFYHTKGELNIDLKQDKQFQRLKELEQEFSSYMKRLNEIELTKELIKALSLHLLGLKFDLGTKDLKRKELEEDRLASVAGELEKLITNYMAELGSSAYTALNVATDLATHSANVTGKFASTAGLQEIIGQRMRIISDRVNELPTLIQSELDLLRSA